jgi:hypothetical protein
MDRLRNGFLLCRCFGASACRFDALMRATGVHPTWSGERAERSCRLGQRSGQFCGRRSSSGLESCSPIYSP